MDINDSRNKIIEVTKKVLENMRLDGTVEFLSGQESDLPVLTITSKNDSRFLIGKNGNNLDALEHLIKAIISKNTDLPRADFILDVNNYRLAKTKYITEAARQLAEKVRQTAKAEALQPMNAFERRLVHLELASYKNISTESIGQEPKRRVVIKPAS